MSQEEVIGSSARIIESGEIDLFFVNLFLPAFATNTSGLDHVYDLFCTALVSSFY